MSASLFFGHLKEFTRVFVWRGYHGSESGLQGGYLGWLGRVSFTVGCLLIPIHRSNPECEPKRQPQCVPSSFKREPVPWKKMKENSFEECKPNAVGPRHFPPMKWSPYIGFKLWRNSLCSTANVLWATTHFSLGSGVISVCIFFFEWQPLRTANRN